MRVVIGFALGCSFLAAAAGVLSQETAQQQPNADDGAAKQATSDQGPDEKDAARKDADKGAPAGEESARQEPAGAAKKDAAANANHPDVKRFNELFAEFRSLVARMREIQRDYKVVMPTGREALEKEFEEKMRESESVFEKLIAAAEAAYPADPANADVADFLGATARMAGGQGKYEEGLRRLNLLAANDYRPQDTYDPLGRFAYRVSEFDTAEQYLKKAEDAKALSPTGKSFLDKLQKTDVKKHWAEELAARKRDHAPDAEPLPQVRLKTTQGDVVVELFENDAPNTVANFITLVEQRFYDDMPFYRVQPGLHVAAGEIPPGSDKRIEYKIPCECYGVNPRRHFRGVLSMDLEGGAKNTGAAKFSIILTPQDLRDPVKDEVGFDRGHTVFGRVIEGLDAITDMPPNSPQAPLDKIIDAEVVRKRKHEYVVKKVETDANQNGESQNGVKEPIDAPTKTPDADNKKPGDSTSNSE